MDSKLMTRSRTAVALTVASAALLTGCASGSATPAAKDDGQPIEVWARAGTDAATTYAAMFKEFTDKTGVQVDGPDADTTPSVYVADTPAAQQVSVSGTIVQRIDFTEGSETPTGGNGVTGNNELSENVNVTFVTATTATPGTP